MSVIKKEDASMTSEEMLDRSSSWTLACDNALLNRLKKFSEDLTKNSQDILRECDALSKDVKKLDYGLINVSNEFHMLSNTQFVENRVEDFEEFSSSISSSNTTTTVKTKAEQEAALVSKMKQAIQLGLAACNERRCPGGTSSDRFKMKQPYIIGSPKFFSSKYCGLVDESRRRVPVYQDPIDLDSVSIYQSSDTHIPSTPVQTKPEIKFTMPPTSVFPVQLPDQKSMFANDNHVMQNEERKTYGAPAVPPSPTISTRSSDMGGGSGSSIPRDNVMPRSVTDELNKIYGSFAPPPAVDDDSDDDFRPSAGVGRIFEDDDDDIFGEKELFPSSQKKTDFFGRSNPSQLPAPIFSAPPPVNPVPQPKPTSNSVQASVGPEPKTNDTPNMNSVTGDISKKDVTLRGPPPLEAEGPFRAKLPPGAVSPFGNLPPPVFNNGTLQQAQTANTNVPPIASKLDTQISCNPTADAGSVFARSSSVSGVNNNITAAPSQLHEDVNQKYATSQPSQNNVTAPGRTENISKGSLSSSRDTRSNVKPKQTVPVSSLFADESSDEDIFSSSKKQHIATSNANQSQKVVSTINPPIISSSSSNNIVSNKQPTRSSNSVKKPAPVKKSIFDDSESEDDLFSSKTPTTRSQSKPVSDNGSIFKPEPKKLSVPVPVKKITSLFSDDSDSDSDLFGNKRTVPAPAKPKMASSVAPAKMEDTKVDTVWDDDDIFKSDTPAQPKEAREASPSKSNLNNNNNESETHATTEKSVIKSYSSGSTDTSKPAIVKDAEKMSEPAAVIKKSIFDDSESDDDLFSSKSNVIASKSDSASSLDLKPKPTVPVISSNKGKSLFDDESDSDGDLFGAKAKRNDIDSNTSVSLSKDNSETNLHLPKNQLDKKDEVDSTLPPSEQPNKESTTSSKQNQGISKSETESKPAKVTGSKISEKIKAMQNAKPDKAKIEETSSINRDLSSKKDIKSKISVKSLALNLNINPLALMGGAKPPKTGGSISTPSTPDREISDPPSLNDVSLPGSPDKSSSEDVMKKTSIGPTVEKDDPVVNESNDDNHVQPSATTHQKFGGVDELVGILKARVKIQRKRRPPTRNFLKSLASHEDKETKKEDETSPDKELDKEGNGDSNDKEASDADVLNKEIKASD